MSQGGTNWTKHLEVSCDSGRHLASDVFGGFKGSELAAKPTFWWEACYHGVFIQVNLLEILPLAGEIF